MEVHLRHGSESELHHTLARRLDVSLHDLEVQHRQRAEELVRAHLQRAGASDAAVLEITFRAKGDAKRRLLRRLARDLTIHCASGSRGEVVARAATPFDWLVFETTLAELLARDAGGDLADWRLISVG